MNRVSGHSVVLGAGMAGLLAARVLSDACERVTVVERDPLPQTAEPRRGVPQGRHAHLLLPGGTEILDGLFTGLFDRLSAAGVPVVRDFAEFWLAPGGGQPVRLHGPAADLFLCQASRPYLEQHVRDHVRALPNVTMADQCDVADLTADATRRRVTGVRVRSRADGGETTIDAGLVVDATGRGSRAPAWLEALGYDRPRQEQLEINLTYVTRHLRIRPGTLTAKVVGVGPQPDRPSGFVLFAQEDDRWILTVFGYDGHHPARGTLGMSTAAMQAAALRDTLAAGDHDVARRFFQAAAEPLNRAWQATVGGDLGLPQVKAPRPLPMRVIGRYAARALRAAARDPVVAAQFLRVGALQDPSRRMLRLPIAIRVLRHGRRPDGSA